MLNQPPTTDNSLSRVRVVARGCAALLAVGWLLLVGCNSVYHRARQSLPPNPSAEYRLRFDDCREAERLVRRAASTARAALVRGQSPATIGTDMDRLELTARDLARRARIAEEAAQRQPAPLAEPSEITRFAELSRELIRWVEAARGGDVASLPALDELLRVTVPR